MPYLAVVVGLALILLLLVFRSIVIPLKAALGFLLSVVSTLGVLVAVFQWGWLKDLFGVDQTGPIVSLLPIVLIGVVFGLAMDYEVFLVSRMREEYVHGAEPTQAVVEGFRHSGRVVTAAAVIMVSVFSGFLLDDEMLIKSIGLGLAAAVFLDAFVVRMTIVPAVMALLGHRSWTLPKWLDRILPNVDVEGEKLRHVLEAEQTDSAPELVPAGVAAGTHAGSDGHGAPHAFTGVHASGVTDAPAPAPQALGKARGLSRFKQRLARGRDATVLAETTESESPARRKLLKNPMRRS
ncbi:hypothetical protein SALBM311S_07048 [Streptomyces alboniger]